MSGKMYLADTRIKKLYLGNIKIKKGFLGDVNVYSLGCDVTYYVDDEVVYYETIEEYADATQPITFTPTKTGYTFVGWRLDNTPVPGVLDEYIIQENEETLSLYAVFKDGTYYYNNGQIDLIEHDYSGAGLTPIQLYKGVNYMFEVWGAQGATGNASYPGGKGGYSKGYYTPSQDETVYLCIGSSAGYNGGGSGAQQGQQWYFQSNIQGYFYNGGGATHIGKVNGLLSNTPVASLLIAAGGGGGAGHVDNWDEPSYETGSESKYFNQWYAGCNGGGLSGETAAHNIGNSQPGTQSSGYAYGQGGPGGGGSGYYGGYGAPQGSEHKPYYGSGSGGSGYIGGVTNGTTTAGINTGNGRAKITIIG